MLNRPTFARHALDGVAIVTATGELDLASSPEFRAQLNAAITEHSPRLVVDLTGVSFMDSTSLADLVAAHNRVEADGGWVRLVAPCASVRKLLEITQLSRLFTTQERLDAKHPDQS